MLPALMPKLSPADRTAGNLQVPYSSANDISVTVCRVFAHPLFRTSAKMFSQKNEWSLSDFRSTLSPLRVHGYLKLPHPDNCTRSMLPDTTPRKFRDRCAHCCHFCFSVFHIVSRIRCKNRYHRKKE